MITAIFIISTAVLAIGWMKWKVATLAIIYYIEMKGYTHPSNKEIDECTRCVAEHLFNDWLCKKKL